jgi:dCMP deaminase
MSLEAFLNIDSGYNYYMLGFCSGNPANLGCSVLNDDVSKIYGKSFEDVKKFVSTHYTYLYKNLLEDKKSLVDSNCAHFLRGLYESSGHIGDSKLFLFGCSELVGVIVRNYLVKLLGAGSLYTACVSDNGKLALSQRDKFFMVLSHLYKYPGLFNSSKYEQFILKVRLSVDESMMESAHVFANRSTCMRLKVGCVITNQEKTNILSMGYNGGVKGLSNCCKSSLPGECGCVHAEVNSLVKVSGHTMYCTYEPCENCARLIINSGIKRVYWDREYRNHTGLDLLNRVLCTETHRVDRDSYSWKLPILENLSRRD